MLAETKFLSPVNLSANLAWFLVVVEVNSTLRQDVPQKYWSTLDLEARERWLNSLVKGPQ